MPLSCPVERIFKQCIGTDVPGCLWIPIGRTAALLPIPVSPQCSGGIHGGRIFAYGTNSHALRLTSELVDLRVAGRRLCRLFVRKTLRVLHKGAPWRLNTAICKQNRHAFSPTPPQCGCVGSGLPPRPNKRGSPNGLPLLFGRDGRIRTYGYQSQSLVPYRLATSL